MIHFLKYTTLCMLMIGISGAWLGGALVSASVTHGILSAMLALLGVAGWSGALISAAAFAEKANED